MISVVLPTYNRAPFLSACIESVLQQSFQDWELIVVDDASTDSTIELLNNYKDPRVKLLRNSDNRGVSFSRNRAIAESQFDWIALIDSDDTWNEKKLFKQWELIKTYPDCRIIHCDEEWVRHGKKVNPKIKHLKKGGDLFLQSTELCAISPSAVLLQKKLIHEMGGFLETYPVCEDYDLWLKICSQYPVYYIEEKLVIKNGGHGDQLSRKYIAMDYWRVKSLHWIMQNRVLSPEQKIKAREQLIIKAQVLLKGYLKHQNLNDYQEINQILKIYQAEDIL